MEKKKKEKEMRHCQAYSVYFPFKKSKTQSTRRQCENVIVRVQWINRLKTKCQVDNKKHNEGNFLKWMIC